MTNSRTYFLCFLHLNNTAEFFSKRRERADMGAFMQILTRNGGQKPCHGDEI